MSDQLPAVRKVTDLDGGPLPRGRVSKRLDKAIRLIEEQGYNITQAAEAVEMRTHSLTQALRKPHVRAHRADVKHAWRHSAVPKAWNRIVNLGEAARSEKVQLEASKTVLTALGELDENEPIKAAGALIQIIRNETHIHGQSLSQRLPGVMEAQEYQEADFQPLDHESGLTPSEDT